MDDIERAVDGGVNTFKALTRDDLFVPSRYPALERYAELQVLTYHICISVTLLLNSKWLRVGNYICETCNCTAHAFTLLQR